jgi:probable rRNA maturation factor
MTPRALSGPAETNEMKPPPLETPEPAVLTVDILIESEAWKMLPEAEDVARRAIAAAAEDAVEKPRGSVELSLLLCDDETIASLNGQWRGQEKPTNVLSFPAPPLPGAGPHDKVPLGDIAIAYETLVREAAESGKTAPAHLAHLVVHGFLHLVGYDHEIDEDAEQMEHVERDILARIGVPDPYAACDADI